MPKVFKNAIFIGDLTFKNKKRVSSMALAKAAQLAVRVMIGINVMNVIRGRTHW